MTTKEAITLFGSARALALALGVSTQAVYKWGETVPAHRQEEIKALAPKARQ